MSQSQFIKNSICPALTKAVIKQSGGWDAFVESAEQITGNGWQGGYKGFTNYNEGIAFAKQNIKKIQAYLYNEAESANMKFLGEFMPMMAENCGSRDEITELEFAQVIFGRDTKHDVYDAVMNYVAWATLTSIAHEYNGMIQP